MFMVDVMEVNSVLVELVEDKNIEGYLPPTHTEVFCPVCTLQRCDFIWLVVWSVQVEIHHKIGCAIGECFNPPLLEDGKVRLVHLDGDLRLPALVVESIVLSPAA